MKVNKTQVVTLIPVVIAFLGWLTSSHLLSDNATIKVLIATNLLSSVLQPLLGNSTGGTTGGTTPGA
jgi:hypothetical protein